MMYVCPLNSTWGFGHSLEVIKANSERALLQQFQRDWEEAMGNSSPWKIF